MSAGFVMYLRESIPEAAFSRVPCKEDWREMSRKLKTIPKAFLPYKSMEKKRSQSSRWKNNGQRVKEGLRCHRIQERKVPCKF